MFIAHYENTMRNARPKVTPVIAAPKVQAKSAPIVKPRPVAKKLPVARGSDESTIRRRSGRRLADAAARAKRDHLADYRSIVRGMGDMPPVKAVIEAVCASHGLAVEDVVGRRKFKILADARIDAIRMVAEVRPDLSSSQIGRFFGRDHTTILYVLGRVGTRAAA